ncbi:MAG TPA: HEAT repeat domain-containing protein, partial [Bryobacteraceae bacterium]|nr:HEAT repeat domain-containing protein [Bryobacteraceae bacterium]
VAPVTLDFLLRDASAIVVAGVEGNIVNGTAVGNLVIERALRGELRPGSAVQLTWTGRQTVQPMSRPLHKDRALFFLRKDAGGHWEIVPGTTGNVEFDMLYFLLPSGLKPEEYRAGPGATIEEKVFLELAWAASVGWPPDRGAVYDLLDVFRGHLNSPAARKTFTQFSRSHVDKVQALDLRALIAEGDLGALERVASEQDKLMASPFGRAIAEDLRFYFRNAEAAAVRILGPLATSENTRQEFRIAAATALARVHTRESLQHLAGLLESPDLMLRTLAVGGLAMFANNVPVNSHHPAPGDWPYRTEDTIAHSTMDPNTIARNESYYVGFWKNWWFQNKETLVTPP